ncbi:helix-turn-helix domain-containing protein [Nitrincola alkalisediminis]|uniref:helix-turn-helix domain-containing protein n=1 Tax=Nitrincola alkalisediminis TaxID=1366656 RepID=UPI0018753D3B|nr:AraC family transcriptional regulator [Nitrincola alkalisediminis]
MIAIPLPFIVSMLLFLLAFFLWVNTSKKAKSSSIFAFICALTTTIVGLRWSVDWTLLRALQPVLASLVPVCAWLCFSQAHGTRMNKWHALGPGIITLGSLSYPHFQPPLDVFLTLMYVGYGIALLRLAPTPAEDIRLSDTEGFSQAERIAGALLLFSAVIDGALAVNFMFYEGRHAIYILTISYALLLPALVLIIAWVGLQVHTVEVKSHPSLPEAPSVELTRHPILDSDAQLIVNQFKQLMQDKQTFRDPDLTLNRLSRKLVIPSRQLSSAINQVYGRNVSQVINEFRINYAKQRLIESDDSITQIYMSAGFHSKSNFNREFSRITGQTPSEFRHA